MSAGMSPAVEFTMTTKKVGRSPRKRKATSMIEVTTHEDVTYFETVHRGVKYMAWQGPDGWELSTHRLALGRSNIGGFKRFDTLAEISEKVQAFHGLPLLLEQHGGVQ